MARRPFMRDITPIGRGGVIKQVGKGGVQGNLGNAAPITGGSPGGNAYPKPDVMPNRPTPYTGPMSGGRMPPFQTMPTPSPATTVPTMGTTPAPAPTATPSPGGDGGVEPDSDDIG